jgi:hypothetical protein
MSDWGKLQVSYENKRADKTITGALGPLSGPS